MDDDENLNRWGAIPGGDELHNLDYDFDDYFSRHGLKAMSDDESRDFQARIYGQFCSTFYKSGGDPNAIPRWIVAYVADRLFDGLKGRPWPDNMRLPWDEPTPWLNPKGERAMSIYCSVENAKRGDPTANVTTLIAAQAAENNVSYETARADYYAVKKSIDWKMGVPDKFLNNKDDF